MPVREEPGRGAQRRRRTLSQQLDAYVQHHRQMLLAGFRELLQHPLANFMTIAVIGIALALPAGALIMVNNANRVTGQWQGAARISLFLKLGVNDSQVRQLANEVRTHAGVAAVQAITASQSLADFKQHSDLGDAIDLLQDNPLPAVLIVKPAAAYLSPNAAQQLAQTLGELPQVAQVRMDAQWLARLQAILDMLHRAAVIVGILLAIAVVLIVGNTIRLEIENRRAEIEVSKLLGASDRFIHRPFLYHGAWYGLAGGILAWILVLVGLALMSGPIGKLASLYSSAFSLRGLGFGDSLLLLVCGIVLGWLGSWIAVARHLRAIEPT